MEARCDRFTFWWFYLVKAAREECHYTSFEKIIPPTISRRYLLSPSRTEAAIFPRHLLKGTRPAMMKKSEASRTFLLAGGSH